MPQQRGDIDKQGEGLMEVPLATMDYTGTEVEIASKQVHEEERHLRAALAGGIFSVFNRSTRASLT